MDKIYEQTMLFDFYGELLTEHQQSVYEDAVYNDLSLGEIAAERGISRQGVHDLLKRCDRILQEYESKLHLVERFTRAKKAVEKIEQLTLLEEPKQEVPYTTGKEQPTHHPRHQTLAAIEETQQEPQTSAAIEEAQSEYRTSVAVKEELREIKERLRNIRELSQELLNEL